MQISLLRSLLLVGLSTGCLGSAQVGVSGPDLVVISPGVQVIADYDEPIFFNDGFYWRNTGGTWYQSTDYTGGWARVDVAPAAIRSIDRPTAYVHYHAAPHANAAASGPVVRDHREEPHAAVQRPAPAVVQRPEPKAERKEERNDDKRGRK